MKRSIFVVGMLLAVLFLFSCSHKPDTSLVKAPDPPPDTSYVTYSQNIKSIAEANCYRGCHDGAHPTSNFWLDTYDSLKLHAVNGHIMERINQDSLSIYSPMPQPPYSKLTAYQISQFQKWINNSYPK